jgi:transcriptional regulator with XRE-family HTH domain
MALGEKLKNARLEAGLSQRQLCGDVITRNMLSRIEHGMARPSMDTLQYLASRLGKPLSWFLEENPVYSPNQSTMESARAAFAQQNFTDALRALQAFEDPDPVYRGEREVLEMLALLGAAESALNENRGRYALELLSRAERIDGPYTGHLHRKRLLLLAKAQGRPREICPLLPSLDEELLLRARAALERGDPVRAAHLLDAVEEQEQPQWHYLRGEALLLRKCWNDAARHFHQAEQTYPGITAPMLEQCYRELGDFKEAYRYACIQKKQE